MPAGNGAEPLALAGSHPDERVRRDLAEAAGPRSPWLFWLFGWYLRWYFFRHFRAVRLALDGIPRIPPDRPVILYSNHPSWWDPALFVLVATLLFPERLHYGPIDARALGKYGLLRRMGVFGIELDSARGAARFLRVCRALLSDPSSMLWITAEGAFTDPRVRPVRLRNGLAHLARQSTGVTILPFAIEYPFWNERAPEALVRFGEPIEADQGRLDVAGWTALLERHLTANLDALAQDSIARDPALFRTLLRGSTGVGGIYDLWRRLRAAATGQRFDPTHGGP